MKLKPLTLLLCLFLFASCTSKDDTSIVKVFLLAGQSNMDGCGKGHELPELYKTMPANVKTWDIKTKEWVTLATDSFAKRRRLQFGPEIALAHRLSKKYPEHEIRFIKVSTGGTALYSQWLPGMGMNKRFVSNIEQACEDLKENKQKYSIIGMFWMQGESDTKLLDKAQQYKSNFAIFKNQIRNEVVKNPQLPIVMGRISTRILKATKWKFTHTKVVQKEQEAIAASDDHIELINTDTFSTLDDQTHFDTQGELDLGNAMYVSMSKYLK